MEGTLAQADPRRRVVGPSLGMRLSEAAAVAVAITLLYLVFIANSHNEGYDGIGYLALIRAGSASDMLNPSHLLFNWIGWVADHFAIVLGYGGGPLRPVQVMNALAGGVGVGLFWLLLRNAGADRVVAAGGCGMVAFSYGYWGMSEDVELYSTSTTLVILTILAAHHAATHPSYRSFGLFGMANGLALLSHNTAFLLTAVAFTALVLCWRAGVPIRRVVTNAFAYAAGAAVVVIPAYAAAIPILHLHSPSAFYDWLTSQAQSTHSDAYAGHWQLTTLPRALVGATRAVTGGHFALSIPTLRDFVSNHFSDKNLRTELYVSRDFNHLAAVVLLAVAALALVVMVLCAMTWLRRPQLTPEARTLALLGLVWGVLYSVFFAWWEPLTLKYWTAPWVAMTILLVLPLASVRSSRWGRAVPVGLAVVVGGLFVVNLFGSVLPQTHTSNDYWRARTEWYERNTTPTDLVFTSAYIQAEYLRYFTHARVVDVRLDVAYVTGEDTVVPEVQRIIDASPGARVLFSSEALFPGEDEYSHCLEPNCTIGEDLQKAFLSRSHVIANEPLGEVWQLDR
jgi:hypothetical protein